MDAYSVIINNCNDLQIIGTCLYVSKDVRAYARRKIEHEHTFMCMAISALGGNKDMRQHIQTWVKQYIQTIMNLDIPDDISARRLMSIVPNMISADTHIIPSHEHILKMYEIVAKTDIETIFARVYPYVKPVADIDVFIAEEITVNSIYMRPRSLFNHVQLNLTFAIAMMLILC